jgi:neutral ceramidase
VLALATIAACGDDGGTTTGVTTDHCDYLAVPATANTGGTVVAGTLTAGAAERRLDVPVGTALGGYTSRAGFLGSAGEVDGRRNQLSGTFKPSVGVVTAPHVKAVALTADGETVVILKIDAIFIYEGMLFDVEERLGEGFRGKVLLASSHSHSAWAQWTGHSALKLGSGELRDLVFQRVLDGFVAAAQEAIANQRPARIGFFTDTDFDPMDQITRDRRGDNDDLMGGPRKDDHLHVIRVDGTDDTPIAVLGVYGVHGTINDDDNPLASNDAPGAAERMLESYLPPGTVVIHLQSGGADTSPTPRGGVDCDLDPGRPTDPCFGSWTAEEGHGRAAAATLYAGWMMAGTGMRDAIEIEMLTRSVEIGPYPETFAIRDSTMMYQPFDLDRSVDGVIYNGTELVSPIDEFNAPVGAGLCETAEPMFPAAGIPGAEGVPVYGSCLRLDVAGEILGEIFDFEMEATETRPLCQTTRTTISALRLGEYVIGSLPGEVSVMIADLVREKSPVAADRTIVVGYAQGHVGYLLRPEDWVLGGYEPSVTFWGPLEGEYLVERLADLMPLATSVEREDGAAGGSDRLATAIAVDSFEIDDPAPGAGTVPATVPPETWIRSGVPATAEPPPTVERVAGIATFVFVGDDPLVATPIVTLERAVGPAWVPVTRAGRNITDGELVISYTPQPLRREPGQAQTHVWAVEYQPVPAWGEVNFSAGNADLGSLPTGQYRFHVRGNGWQLPSMPFDVVAGGFVASATRMGTNARVTLTWNAPRGWRLLDLDRPSNRPVPVKQSVVTVRFLSSGGSVLATGTGTTDDAGVVTVDGGGPGNPATQVEVEDGHGNVTTAPLS